jgi:rare lipoprotein A (peptidoglycan hydrolase)
MDPTFRRLGVLVAMSFAVLLIWTPAYGAQRRHGVARTGSKQLTRASWYGANFQGRRMAGGGIFNPHRLTAAHPTLHLGSRVKVTELRTGRSVIVRITDRGPFYPGRGIDLSYAAARELGMVRRGVATVEVQVLDSEHVKFRPPVVSAFNRPTISWRPTAIVE